MLFRGFLLCLLVSMSNRIIVTNIVLRCVSTAQNLSPMGHTVARQHIISIICWVRYINSVTK